MTKSKTFTVAELNALPPGKHCDGEGLWFLKSPNGKARWFFRYTLYGRQRETGLGKYPLISLAEARRLAEENRRVVANGADPVKLKRRMRDQLASTSGRFDVLAQRAYEAHRKTMKTQDRDGKWYVPFRTRLLPRLAKMPVLKIDQQDIRDALKSAWHDKPSSASDAFHRLRIIYKYALAEGFDVDLAVIDKAKILLGPRVKPVKHHEAMAWSDAPAFYATLGDVAAVELTLRMLTGVRSDAVNQMRYDQIEGAVWTIPVEHVKGKIEHVQPFRVPLSAEALRVVELTRAVSQNDILFPNAVGGPLNKMAMRNHLTDHGVTARPHGFRSTIRTWIAENEICSDAIGEAVIGHLAKGKVVKAYNRADYFQNRIPVMDAYAQYLTGKS